MTILRTIGTQLQAMAGLPHRQHAAATAVGSGDGEFEALYGPGQHPSVTSLASFGTVA